MLFRFFVGNGAASLVPWKSQFPRTQPSRVTRSRPVPGERPCRSTPFPFGGLPAAGGPSPSHVLILFHSLSSSASNWYRVTALRKPFPFPTGVQ